MKKYSREDVVNYINGDDVEGFDIDELENNPSFMKDVINISNDYHFYNLCSDNVKIDIDFVEFYINKFKDKTDLICDVADNYLYNFDDDEDNDNIFELIIMMDGYTKGKNTKKKHLPYAAILEEIYLKRRDDYYKSLSQEEEYDFGFWEIYNEFNHRPLIVDFFAKKIVTNIYIINGPKFFENMSKTFSCYEEFEKYGICKYILEFIDMYDEMLASYLSGHIELLGEWRKEIERKKNKWPSKKSDINKYKNSDKIERYGLIEEFTKEYFEHVDNKDNLNYINILYNIGIELGIKEDMLKYALNMKKEDLQYLDENMKSSKVINFDVMKHYNNIKNIVIKILATEDVSKIGNFDDFIDDLGISFRER